MAASIEKSVLIEKIQGGYEQFEALIAPLSEEQMTIPRVNGPWSIKDNLSHLAFWQGMTDENLMGLIANQQPQNRLPHLEAEDAINDYIYQENKDRSLAEVVDAFHDSYQHLLDIILSLSEEQLNSPFPWSENQTGKIWEHIAGNTYEHYEEHGDIIRNWLAQISE